MNKLRDHSGETLLETLAAILIAALAFSFLATAAVTATRINARTRGTDNSFHYAGTAQPRTITLTEGASAVSGTVDLCEDNGYLYYTGGRVRP